RPARRRRARTGLPAPRRMGGVARRRGRADPDVDPGRSTSMTTATARPALRVGPRTIPPPTSVSEAARAYLAAPVPAARDTAYPALGDEEGWRAPIAAFNAKIALLEQAVVAACAVEIERTTMNGARAAIVRPKNPDPRFDGRILMNIH